MKYISSVDNSLVLKTVALKEKKFRKEYNKFLVEGENLVSALLASKNKAQYIFVEEKSIYENFNTSAEKIVVTRSVIEKISDTVTPQGIIAVCDIPPVGIPTGKSCVILDKVQDPGNVGAIIRTAVAAGIQDIFLINCVDVYSPKVVRSSMGGIFFSNIYNVGYGAVLDYVKRHNLCLVASDMVGKNVFNIKSIGEFALVLGSEAHGISEILRFNANKTVSIPMENCMESLNVAVSSGILMYVLKSRIQKNANIEELC